MAKKRKAAKKTAKRKAAKKTAKRKAVLKGTAWEAPKLEGLTFVLSGLSKAIKKELTQQINAEKGVVTNRLGESVHYLVLDEVRARGKSAAQKQAEALNKAGATIGILENIQVYGLLQPSRDECLAMLAAGPKGIARFNALVGHDQIDLSSCDFSGAKLVGAQLESCHFAKADFSGADLSGATLPPCSGTSFRAAKLVKADFTGADMLKCDFREADLSKVVTFYTEFEGCDFSGANLSDLASENLELKACNLSQAVLKKAKLKEALFERVDLSKANLQGADLSAANLAKADLRGANLRKANLTGACLDQAKLAGADFTGAAIDGLRLDGADTSAAKGLDLEQAFQGKLGPKLKELDKVANKAERIKLKYGYAMKRGAASVSVDISCSGSWKSVWANWTLKGDYQSESSHKTGPSGILLTVASRLARGSLQANSIKVSSSKSTLLQGKALKELVVAALHEAAGEAVPDPDALKTAAKKQRTSAMASAASALETLQAGKVGGWKKLRDAVADSSFKKSDLSGKKLDGVSLKAMDFRQSNFAGASLKKANLEGAKLQRSDLSGANLRGAKLDYTNLRGANLSGADLSGAKFLGVNLSESNLVGADLSKANLKEADLRAADLTRAKLEGTTFGAGGKDGWYHCVVTYDERTQLPEGFVPPPGMQYKGLGKAPHERRAVAEPGVKGSLTAESFVERLPTIVDSGRLKKSLKMLKKSKFQLYSKVDADQLVGVVKSQTDAKLVYSCRLGSDGVFACCTQNLNVCGGLRGALCKHLLVLIVGLVRSGGLDAATLAGWVEASQSQSPKLDKDQMSETFLQYKGAEAGDVDWRPTETVPEDYFAF